MLTTSLIDTTNIGNRDESGLKIVLCQYADYRIIQPTKIDTRIRLIVRDNMKLSKVDIDNMAKVLSDKLLANPGLKDAKRIVNQVKKNLTAEYKRRKNL